MTTRMCAGLFATLAGAAVAPASEPPRPVPRVRLQSGAFAPGPIDHSRPIAFEQGRRYVLTLDGPLGDDRRGAIEATGARVLDYLPDHAALVSMSKADGRAVAQLPFVTGIAKYADEWKVAGSLRARARAPFETAERKALAESGLVAAGVYLFEDEGLAEAQRRIMAVPGAKIVGYDSIGAIPGLIVVLPPASLDALSSIPAVRAVEEVPEWTPRNDQARWIAQSNVPNLTPVWNHGITGQGQIVGLIDDGLARLHCSFLDSINPVGPFHRKILAFNSNDLTNRHGTHVGGTLAGDSGDDSDRRGLAYSARIVFNNLPGLTEASMYDRLALHYSQGAFVHNNSFGNNSLTAYVATCVAIDKFCWLYDDNLVVFAVADRTTIFIPENAKNCLSVTASGSAGNQQNICIGGIGPTPDGRRKPDIAGPGCGIVSASYLTTDPCGLRSDTGTSFATPVVTGVGVLMRQYFTDGFYPTGARNSPDAFNPSGTLLKAMLINSAVDVTGIAGFPSNREGWGRLLADNALYFAGDSRRLHVRDVRNACSDALTTGEADQWSIAVASPAEALKVTLAFYDAPGALNAANPVVNDLDLIVTDPQNRTYRGNVFASGVSAEGGAADAINSVEQVLIAAPEPGIWTIRIEATAVNVGRQGYAVAVTGDLSGPCRADLNYDGSADATDYGRFLQAFDSADPCADLNGDGFVDAMDYDAYVYAFLVTCDG